MNFRRKQFGFRALGLALVAPVARAETSQAEQIQAALESWVAERVPAEKITGVAALCASFLGPPRAAWSWLKQTT